MTPSERDYTRDELTDLCFQFILKELMHGELRRGVVHAVLEAAAWGARNAKKKEGK